jgi:hypothetical protein
MYSTENPLTADEIETLAALWQRAVDIGEARVYDYAPATGQYAPLKTEYVVWSLEDASLTANWHDRDGDSMSASIPFGLLALDDDDAFIAHCDSERGKRVIAAAEKAARETAAREAAAMAAERAQFARLTAKYGTQQAKEA